MVSFDLRSLIKSGMHFGHQASRWNPKMKPFIFKKRNLIHIIDLRESVRGMIAGAMLVEKIAAMNQHILFVGTKRQAKQITREQAVRCGQPYVADRWPGGMLTNYSTVRLRLDRMRELERLETTGEVNLYSKKMVSTLRRELRKITRNLGGVRDMDKIPGAIVLVDPTREHNALAEANKLGVPTIALADTDCDPDPIDIVVPGNDDSIGAIEVFLSCMADAALRGVARRQSMMPTVGEVERAKAAGAAVGTSAQAGAVAADQTGAQSAPPQG